MGQGEFRVWNISEKGAYVVSAMGSIAALYARFRLGDALDDSSVFLFASVPVALAAFLGGLGPGLVATLIGLVGTIYFFIPPVNSLGIASLSDRVSVAGFGLLWIFVSIICGYLRQASIRLIHERAEAEVHRVRLDSILGSMTDAFFSVNRDWRIRLVNSAFERMMGKSREELRSHFLWDLFRLPQHEEMRFAMAEAMKVGTPYLGDIQIPGSTCWYHVRAFPAPEGMFVYMQEITDRKQLEQSRERMLASERRARSEAETMNRMKDEFVATLSHELRTPLTTILGWTEILLRNPKLDDKSKEGLAVIEKSVRQQTQLIADLLDMSRMAAGKLKLETEFLDLAELTEEAMELARPTAAAKGIDLVAPKPFEAAIVRADPQRLHQILANLLSNAIKFSTEGNPVEVSVRAEGGQALCRVTDFGEGIDPDFFPFLFDRFRQSDSSTTRRHGGLGLGLAIVRQLVDLHGGEVKASSEGKGKGSWFEFSIPLSGIAPSLNGQVEPLPPRAFPTGARILVVDDDPETRNLLGELLTASGAIVITAESGQSALELLGSERFDLMVSDIGMPEMDGYQFLKLARMRFEDLNRMPPAIALSAFAHESDHARSIEAGFAQHLTKPVDRTKLLQEIARFVRSGEAAEMS